MSPADIVAAPEFRAGLLLRLAEVGLVPPEPAAFRLATLPPRRRPCRWMRTGRPHERGSRAAGRGARAPRAAAGRRARGRLRLLVPRLPRRDDRQHRVPRRARVVHGRDARGPLVDPQRLRDRLRRAARPGRPARRPRRRAAAVPRRPRRVHRRLRAVRDRAVGAAARRRPRAAGRRRRDARRLRPAARDGGAPARAAHASDRAHGRRRRARVRPRSRARRPDGRPRRLAARVPRQPPDRARGALVRAADARAAATAAGRAGPTCSARWSRSPPSGRSRWAPCRGPSGAGAIRARSRRSARRCCWRRCSCGAPPCIRRPCWSWRCSACARSARATSARYCWARASSGSCSRTRST